MGQLYDQIANSYDAWFDTAEGRIVDRIQREAVYSFLKPQVGMKLLDIGCGTGHYSLDLASMGLDITGVDISSAMLEKARLKVTETGLTANFLEADAQCLPFTNEIFDLVLSVTALELTPNLHASLREAYRVLKPNGRLVVGLIGRDSAWWRYYAEKASQNPDSTFTYARFYNLDELLAAMPGREVRGKSVLFVPPDYDFTLEDKAMILEATEARTGRTDGGFICAVSVK